MRPIKEALEIAEKSRVADIIRKHLSEINRQLGTNYVTIRDIIESNDLLQIWSIAKAEETVDRLRGRLGERVPLGIHGPLHREGGKHSHPFLDEINTGEHKFHRRLLGTRRSFHLHPKAFFKPRTHEWMPHYHMFLPAAPLGFHFHYDLAIGKILRLMGKEPPQVGG